MRDHLGVDSAASSSRSTASTAPRARRGPRPARSRSSATPVSPATIRSRPPTWSSAGSRPGFRRDPRSRDDRPGHRGEPRLRLRRRRGPRRRGRAGGRAWRARWAASRISPTRSRRPAARRPTLAPLSITDDGGTAAAVPRDPRALGPARPRGARRRARGPARPGPAYSPPRTSTPASRSTCAAPSG